ncbi:hypothetical protein MTO96_036957 [Rhipicephalus appendiculatus]
MGSAGGRIAFAPALTWVVLLISVTIHASHQDERLLWCGKRLNPRDFARGMRAATDLMLACKDQIVTLNLSPLVLRVLMEEIRLNVTNLLIAANVRKGFVFTHVDSLGRFTVFKKGPWDKMFAFHLRIARA